MPQSLPRQVLGRGHCFSENEKKPPKRLLSFGVFQKNTYADGHREGKWRLVNVADNINPIEVGNKKYSLSLTLPSIPAAIDLPAK